MKRAKSIEPKNLAAQFHYRGAGNPPTTHPSTAVSNSFPGLEMDFRNIWKHVFEGIELMEYSNLVVAVDPGADKKIQRLVGRRQYYALVEADGKPMIADLKGPSIRANQQITGFVYMELSNALAEVLLKAGQFVNCRFQNLDNERKVLSMKLKVRHFFDVDLNRQGEIMNRRVVIAREMAGPGELTQSLCSPWQNDYRECGCFYWSASRPDYVNIEPGKTGGSTGNNWMEKSRTKGQKPSYLVDSFEGPVFLTYAELFTNWEKNLRFVIGGKEIPVKKPRKKARR